MGLPRVRFTVRRIMVAVAIAGSLLGMTVWLIRRAEVFRLAAIHHRVESFEISSDRTPKGSNARTVRFVRHHDSLAAKYAFAARYPWLPVAPDPPEPE